MIPCVSTKKYVLKCSRNQEKVGEALGRSFLCVILGTLDSLMLESYKEVAIMDWNLKYWGEERLECEHP